MRRNSLLASLMTLTMLIAATPVKAWDSATFLTEFILNNSPGAYPPSFYYPYNPNVDYNYSAPKQIDDCQNFQIPYQVKLSGFHADNNKEVVVLSPTTPSLPVAANAFAIELVHYSTQNDMTDMTSEVTIMRTWKGAAPAAFDSNNPNNNLVLANSLIIDITLAPGQLPLFPVLGYGPQFGDPVPPAAMRSQWQDALWAIRIRNDGALNNVLAQEPVTLCAPPTTFSNATIPTGGTTTPAGNSPGKMTVQLTVNPPLLIGAGAGVASDVLPSWKATDFTVSASVGSQAPASVGSKVTLKDVNNPNPGLSTNLINLVFDVDSTVTSLSNISINFNGSYINRFHSVTPVPITWMVTGNYPQVQ